MPVLIDLMNIREEKLSELRVRLASRQSMIVDLKDNACRQEYPNPNSESWIENHSKVRFGLSF